MIIRKKNIKKQNASSSSPSTVQKQAKSSVIKKEDLETNIIQPKGEQIIIEEPSCAPPPPVKPVEMEEFEKIDISSIEFQERIERRRGDRRRGYRRIDERSLVTRAQLEAHNIKELAAREGYKAGLAQAQDELNAIKASLTKFLSMKDEMYNDFYPHIEELALACCRKIIKKEVESSHEILKNIIMGAMEELNSDVQKVEIKVNPEDVEFARASLPEIIETQSDGAKLMVSGDNGIEQGSCVLIANNGVIDANFKTQLAVLQSAFGLYRGDM